ncbi:unnamed protein product [Ixodes hexagonus]
MPLQRLTRLTRVLKTRCPALYICRLAGGVPPHQIPDHEGHRDVWASTECPDYTQVEEVKGHWHFVERLLPLKVVPEPPKHDGPAPSGWRPPPPKAPPLPYYVRRSRNHLLPVYLHSEIRGPRFITRVKNVEGDLWALHNDLKKHLEGLCGKEVLSQVHELGSYVGFKGCLEDEPVAGVTKLNLNVNDLESNGGGDDGQEEKDYEWLCRDMSDEVYPNETPFVKLACDVAFEGLTEREKCYAHYLCRASWYGGLIVLFQASRSPSKSPLIFLLLERLFRSQDLDSLRSLATEQCDFDEEEFKALLVYAAAFYSNMGNYKGFGDNKFIPNLPKEKLHKLVSLSEASKQDSGTMEFLWSQTSDPLYSLRDNEKHLGFPPAGTTTYFSKNCTKQDSDLVGKFLTEKGIEGYITRVFKKATEAGDQDCYEIRYASALTSDDLERSELLGCELLDKGRVCFTRGDYSGLLKLTVDNLQKAQEFAANDNQRQMLGKYIESFTVGSLDAHKDGSRFWTKDKGPSVESYIGFIETYRDPAGMRGEFEGFVAMVNRPQSEKFGALVERAESLLRLLPWQQPFEKDQFLRPDFTSLDVVAFAGSGIPAGINIPNYDNIRQNEGFKNVSLGNVINADDKSSKANFLSPEDNELFNKYKNGSFEVQVGLHELLGHGSGKLFVQRKDGSFNFDRDSVVLPSTRFCPNPEPKVTSWYKDNETYDSVFGPLGSSYEECRAECVGLHLCTNEDVLRLFGFEGQEGQDLAYVNWLAMVAKGVEGLQTYNPRTKTWLQAHSRARYVIMRVLLEAGDLVQIKETTGEDGKPDLLVTLDRSKILSVGAPVIEQFLLQLQLYKSTADVKSATELYDRYSEVSADGPHPFLKYWDVVMARKKPRRIFVQANTMLEGDKVQLRSYDASPEGHLQSWLDRFACSAKDLDRIVLETWKKDQDCF